MPDALDRLEAMASRLDRQIDRMAIAYQRQMEEAFAYWRAEVAFEVGRRTRDDGRLKGSPPMPTRRLTRSWEAGPLSLAERGAQSVAAVGTNVLDGLRIAGLDTTLSREARATLDAAYRMVRDELTETLQSALGASLRALVRGATTHQDAREVLAEIDDLLARVVRQARTKYETALMTFAQTLVAAQSADTDVFAYIGPVDSRIRNFCLMHVGKAWTRQTIDRLDNGQLPNTFLTRGGYNCRHLWHPIRDPSLVALADTRRFLSAEARSSVQATRASLRASPHRRTA